MLIAELGINHSGNMELAKRMIRAAKEGGADLVKAQLYNAEDDKGKPHYEAAKQAQLTFDQAKELFEYARSIGIEMFFSVFGVEYVQWCEAIGVKRYKIAACQALEFQLQATILETDKPIIWSVPRGILTQHDGLKYPPRIRYLYCILDYPTPLEHILLPDFSKVDGWSDHTIGMDCAKIALARGARIIEKHFCLDKSTCYEGLWSMEPDELRELKRWEKICQKVIA